jgi:NADPH:quinone reductase-like Zn-dependent oxidoreductase
MLDCEMAAQTMRACVLEAPDAQPRLVDAPRPEIGPSDVLVRVAASSINPHEAHVISGGARAYLEYEFPITLGNDFAGVVVEVGSDVTGLEPGDEVFGVSLEPVAHRGTFAEYAAIPERFVAIRPANVDELEAAVLGLAAIAAVVCVDAVDPTPGEIVLINGATGGVGSYATQIVGASLACVIATARPGTEERHVRELGASETIDWTAGDVAAAVRRRHEDGIDGLIDLINADAARFAGLAGRVLNQGGRAVSTLQAADPGRSAGRSVANVFAAPDRAQLDRIAVLAGAGVLRACPSQVYGLEQIQDALAALSEGAVGKIAIRIAHRRASTRMDSG